MPKGVPNKDNRDVCLVGPIDAQAASDFFCQIRYLMSDDPDAPIRIFLNSPGGSVPDGLLIYDVIRSLGERAEVWCIGQASSIAAIILGGGAKGHRFLLPHASVTIHEPMLTALPAGSATAVRLCAEELERTKDHLVRLLTSDTGRSRQEIEQAILFETTMHAREAIRFGICDAVRSAPWEVDHA